VLSRLSRPTLVLWTEDNPGQSTELAERVSADLPDGRFEVLTDCAHWPQFERPETFNDIHLEFLSGQAPPFEGALSPAETYPSAAAGT
jgi:2-hydroxy-6-oxonona-2,4-dienedioate hydrolase